MKEAGIKHHFALVKNLCETAGKYFALFPLLWAVHTRRKSGKRRTENVISASDSSNFCAQMFTLKAQPERLSSMVAIAEVKKAVLKREMTR